ncbi:unnamed protein product [Rotaria sordida]|uniref:Uncharacterized protein n=1 Tax=Rotaria sordida TaxID=392033 RepID=A0A814DE61_9BILA|nr:unnamed protein product [Rotaria sordida]CAF3602866.1 unnamed protein product [Rotaria sordida]
MFLTISITILILIFLWILSQTNLCGWLCSIIVRNAKRYRCQQRPKRLILIRHGESQGNEDPSIYATVPDHAIGLTDKGRVQARHCGNKLKKLIGINDTVTCYVSPFRRSRETCELICEAFSEEKILKVREDPRIREQEWGNFQDLARREITAAERQKIGRFFYRFRNGESGADVYDRVSLFMDSLYRQMDNKSNPNNNILIVSHGLFIRLFLMRFFRWSVEEFHTLKNFDNCGYCILERNNQDGRFKLERDLRVFSERKSIDMKNLKEKFNDQSFDEEINSTIHMKNINTDEQKNE